MEALLSLTSLFAEVPALAGARVLPIELFKHSAFDQITSAPGKFC